MRRSAGLAVGLLLATSCRPSALTPRPLPPIDGFAAHRFGSGYQAVPFRLFSPRDYDPSKRYPLVVWMHGAGGMGTDNLAQIAADQIPSTRVWTAAAQQARHPAFVLVPQSSGLWTVPEHVDDIPRIGDLIDSLARELPLDSTRFYVAGQSSGGSAAWTLVSRRPTLFAAAIILCPAMPLDIPPDRARIPVWIFQGSEDSQGMIENSRAIQAAVRAAGGAPRYTDYHGMGHDIWVRALTEPDLADWLFAQHR